MAGTLGDGGDDDGMITGINVTPLVDVVLVLLIIFMVTASYIVRETIEVNLPEAANAGETVETTLAVVLDKEGRWFLNGQPVDEKSFAVGVKALKKEADSKGEKLQAILAADKDISHGAVVHLIDTIKGLGVHKFAINIERDPTTTAAPPAGEPTP